MSTMIRYFSRLRGIFPSVALLLLLVSCMDEDETFVSEPVEVAYVSIYHAVPDAPPFEILVDDRAIGSGMFAYTDHTDYLNFFTGTREFSFRSANAPIPLVDTTFSLEDEKAYSLFAVNRLDDLEVLLVADSVAVPAAGKAMVRLIHLSPDAEPVDITHGDAVEPLFQASFKEATAFREVEAGTYTFQLKEHGTGEGILTSDNINVRAGGYYTLIVRGFRSPPDGSTSVLALDILD